MSMPHHSLLLFLALGSLAAAAGGTSPYPKPVILPLTKDPSTLQYLTQIQQRTPQVNVSLVVDIGGVYLWINCDTNYVSSSYAAAKCGSANCHLFKSRKCNGPCYLNVSKPGCNDDSCDVNVYNPVTGISTSGEVTTDLLTVYKSTPDRSISLKHFPFTCTPDFLIEGLAKGASGMAGLGRGRMGIPELLASELSLKRRFAVCLGPNGAVAIGQYSGLSEPMTYTRLILNPVYTAGIRYIGDASTDYFIGLKSININNKAVKLNSTLLKISSQNGVGGTKLSTVHPYTTTESSIYAAILTSFKTELAHISPIEPVAPFGLCYESISFRDTAIGPSVPRIDLVLERGAKWSIYGANSMVRVSDGVVCLGIVDGGSSPSPMMTSIVVGAHQLENVVMEFDLADSILGFSSSLLARNATCDNFNFI